MVSVGRLKLSYSDLFFYSLEDLTDMIEGHEIDYRDAWERSRWQAMQFLSPHLKKNSKMKPTDLIRFPWEDGKQIDKANRRERLIEAAKESKDFFAQFDKMKAEGRIIPIKKKDSVEFINSLK